MADRVVVQSSGSGVGAAGLLGVAFVVLKLTGYINWSWLWVLAPFWIPWVLVGAIIVIVLVFMLLGAITEAAFRKKRRKIKKASKALNQYERSFR